MRLGLLVLAAVAAAHCSPSTNPSDPPDPPQRVVDSIEISPAALDLFVGDEAQLTVTLFDQDGQRMTGTVSFESSKPAVIGVSAGGLVSALAEGSAQVRASSGSVSSSIPVSASLRALRPTRDTTLRGDDGPLEFESMVVPAGVTVRVAGGGVLEVERHVEVSGKLVADCGPLSLAGFIVLVRGIVDVRCDTEPGSSDSLRIQSEVLEVKGGKVASSGVLEMISALAGTLDGSDGPRGASAEPGDCVLTASDIFGGEDGGPGSDGADVVLTCAGDVLLDEVVIEGREGADGRDAMVSPEVGPADAAAGSGGSGGRVTVEAGGDIVFAAERGGSILRVGSGGAGGDATATANSPGEAASARAGDGGDAGELVLRAGGSMTFEPGGLAIELGTGGDGGNAAAAATDGLPAQAGGSAGAVAGRGGDTPPVIVDVAGSVIGFGNVSVSGGDGGGGGGAEVAGGSGGSGSASRPDGGRGGSMHAQAGDGGLARSGDLFDAFAAGSSGSGGSASFAGGRGGDGFDGCSVDPAVAGGTGGRGGDGTGGGGSPAATIVTAFAEAGVGDGGRGGNGSPAGRGGAGGSEEIRGLGGSADPPAPMFRDGADGQGCAPEPVAEVVVTPPTSDILVGGTVQLAAETRDADGNGLTGRAITWSSSNNAVATVNASGRVTGVAPGTVTITATSEGVGGTATVKVSNVPVAQVVVTPPTSDILVGGTVQLVAETRDADGNRLTGRAIRLSSSNNAVATVNSSGRVTGVAPGTVTVTATSEGVSGTATVNVSNVPVAEVVVTPPTSDIPVGGTVQLAAETRDADGNTLTGRAVTWSSSDDAVATVNSSGRVTGVAPGTVTMTATSEGVSGTATVNVTGQPPVADAGPDATHFIPQGFFRITIPLDGSGSNDPDGTIESYSWTDADGNVIATTATTSVTLFPGTFTFTLEVTDNDGLTDSDDVVITMERAPPQPPSANAGPDQTVVDVDNSGDEVVTLQGSGIDPDGGGFGFLTFEWTENGSVIATGENPDVVLSVGVHVITLTVTDNQGLTGEDDVVVTVVPPRTRPRVFLAEGGEVRVLDLETDQITSTLTVGGSLTGIGFTPDGSLLHVLDSQFNELKAIDPVTLEVVRTIPPFTLGEKPLDLAYSPDGALLYLLRTGGLDVYDVATGALLNRVFLESATTCDGEIVVTPDAAWAYVTRWCTGEILKINLGTKAITTFSMGAQPFHVDVSPPGVAQTVYAVMEDVPQVAKIDVQSDAITMLNVGVAPKDVAVKPDGSEAWVTDRLDFAIEVIDAVTNGVTRRFAGELQSPGNIEFGPNGSTVVMCGLPGLYRIDVPTGIVTTLALDPPPCVFAVEPLLR